MGELAAIAPERRSAVQRFGQSEIEDLDFAVAGELDVGGFQIAVNDALFVGGFERFGDLPGRWGAPRRAEWVRRDTFGERGPVDQFHHQRARCRRILPGRKSRRYAGWFSEASDLRFALEAGHAVGVLRRKLRAGTLRATSRSRRRLARGRPRPCRPRRWARGSRRVRDESRR